MSRPGRRSRIRLIALAIIAIQFIVHDLAMAQDPLRMGIFPRRNATATIKIFKPMAEYLSAQLDREVILVTTKDFPSFWRGVEKQQYDLVHYNQLHYLQSREAYGYQVILMNEENGENTIRSAITVRKNNGIQHLADLRGKTITFGGDTTAMISYIANTVLLRRAGLLPGDYKEIFSKNPPNACIASYYGVADAAGIGVPALSMPVVKKRIKVEQMAILATSEPVSHLPWAVHSSIDEKTRTQIINSMLELIDSDAGKDILAQAKLTALRPATDDDYLTSARILREFETGQAHAAK
jgi:phosphonate transport system substrate-binding protein